MSGSKARYLDEVAKRDRERAEAGVGIGALTVGTQAGGIGRKINNRHQNVVAPRMREQAGQARADARGMRQIKVQPRRPGRLRSPG